MTCTLFVSLKLYKFMFQRKHFGGTYLILLLPSTGCCEVYERIAAVYDATGTFWFNLGVLSVKCCRVGQSEIHTVDLIVRW